MSFWDWFIGESGAAWILGILAIIGSLFVAFKRRNDIARVVVVEVKSDQFLKNPIETIKETPFKERLKFVLLDKEEQKREIDALYYTRLHVFDAGSVDITGPVELVIRIEKSIAAILGFRKSDFAEVDCNASDVTLQCLTQIPEFGSVRSLEYLLTIPFLNSRKHSHIIPVEILAEEEVDISVEPYKVGKGWSLATWSDKKVKKWVGGLAVAVGFIYLFLVSIVLTWFDLEVVDISSFTWTGYFVIAGFAGWYVYSRWLRRLFRQVVLYFLYGPIPKL